MTRQFRGTAQITPYREGIGDVEGAAALKNVSLVAWQHINLHGRYEFTKNTDPIDMNEIIRVLAGFRAERLRGA